MNKNNINIFKLIILMDLSLYTSVLAFNFTEINIFLENLFPNLNGLLLTLGGLMFWTILIALPISLLLHLKILKLETLQG